MIIPKIIHQIWSGKHKPLSNDFLELAQTWKDLHCDWQYVFWNDQKMELFMEENYPQYVESFNLFAYDVQRWDVIRYLILYKMGGLYVDFDTECLNNIEPLLKTDCCFGTDKKDNIIYAAFVKNAYLNNTYMASVPEHPFMKAIIEHVFNLDTIYIEDSNKLLRVLQTSGALMLSDMYSQYPDKESIRIIPAEEIAPFSLREAYAILSGEEKQEWEERLQNAFAVHYFIGSWGYYN